MDLTRFAALCDAYGGAIARWPAGERDAAARIARTGDGARLLARADRLDAALDGWTLAPVPQALAMRIASAGPHRKGARVAAWWWSGFAGLTLAGAAAGALAVTALPPLAVASDDGGYADTAFGGWEAPR